EERLQGGAVGLPEAAVRGEEQDAQHDQPEADHDVGHWGIEARAKLALRDRQRGAHRDLVLLGLGRRFVLAAVVLAALFVGVIVFFLVLVVGVALLVAVGRALGGSGGRVVLLFVVFLDEAAA